MIHNLTSRAVIEPPAVVGPGIYFRGLRITYVPRVARRALRAVLLPPAAIGAGIVFRPLQTRVTAYRGAQKTASGAPYATDVDWQGTAFDGRPQR